VGFTFDSKGSEVVLIKAIRSNNSACGDALRKSTDIGCVSKLEVCPLVSPEIVFEIVL
jgi:hypothetical protein